MAKITTGQLVTIIETLESRLLAKAELHPTIGGHVITMSEKALYLDELVMEINKVLKNKTQKRLAKDTDKFDFQLVRQHYPPTLHTDHIGRAFDFLRHNIKTDDDFKNLLLAVKAYKADRDKVNQPQYTMKFSNWVKAWREYIPKAPLNIVPKVLDAADEGF